MDLSFNINRAAFNGGVLAIAPGLEGAIDPAFAIGSAFNANVSAIAAATDGSGDVYVGGIFTDFNGSSANRFIRLNADGTADFEFDLGSGFDDEVYAIAPTSDGSGDVYAGGYFTSYDGTPSNGIIRLNADGTRDLGFASGAGFDEAVWAMALATDGSGDVYVGGNFESYDGTNANYVIRLNSDGTRDAEFAIGTGFGYSVEALALTTDGSGDLYAGGAFVDYNGMNSNRIIRLNADGTPDPGFAVGAGFNSSVTALALASDGSGDVYAGGAFSSYNGTSSNGIVRLNADGTPDLEFAVGAGFDSGVAAIALASDGSGDVYAGGAFISYDGIESNRIVRLNSDGSRDAGLPVGTGPDGFVTTVALATDGSGDVYVGGFFVAYNATNANRIVRLEVGRTFVGGSFVNVNDSIGSNRMAALNADDSIDGGFDIGTGFDFNVHVIASATDGSGDVYVGGAFQSLAGTAANAIARLDPDGTKDTGLDIGSGFNDAVLAIAPAVDGSGDVYVGGRFTDYNGTSANRVIRLNDDGTVDSSFATGSGLDFDVIAVVLATDGTNDVYVGGAFLSYGGVASASIVRLNADGSMDTGFDIGMGFNGDVHAIAPATDGSADVYVGGRFTSYNGTVSSRIIRLQADGTSAGGFLVGAGFNFDVNEITPAADATGDIYVGGDFVTYDGKSANAIVRLNPDGSRDKQFAVGSGFDGSVFSIARATDDSGDVYVGGMFFSYNGIESTGIVRLRADGTVGSGFGAGEGLDDDVLAIAPARDGSSDVFVGGAFTSYEELASNGLIRLHADGQRDAGFSTGSGFDDQVEAIAPATNGSGDVYVGGQFHNYAGASANNIIRLNADGTADSGFLIGAGFDGSVHALAVATDGSGDIYAGGGFSSYNGTSSKGLVRLNEDGTLDSGFAVGAGFNFAVRAVALAIDGSGDVYVGGDFFQYDGTYAGSMIRLNADGTIDNGFAMGAGFDGDVHAIALAIDGSNDVYVGGGFITYDVTESKFIIRLNANGSLDAEFDIGAGFDDRVKALALATDGTGDVYAGGNLSTYQGMSANSIIRLKTDGTREGGFASGAGFDDDVLAMAEARDGSQDVYVGGRFTKHAGQPVGFACALNPDGSLD